MSSEEKSRNDNEDEGKVTLFSWSNARAIQEISLGLTLDYRGSAASFKRRVQIIIKWPLSSQKLSKSLFFWGSFW